jgi:hypothetical protein
LLPTGVAVETCGSTRWRKMCPLALFLSTLLDFYVVEIRITSTGTKIMG